MKTEGKRFSGRPSVSGVSPASGWQGGSPPGAAKGVSAPRTPPLCRAARGRRARAPGPPRRPRRGRKSMPRGPVQFPRFDPEVSVRHRPPRVALVSP